MALKKLAWSSVTQDGGIQEKLQGHLMHTSTAMVDITRYGTTHS